MFKFTLFFALLFPANAMAQAAVLDIIFYEGNGCRQDVVCKLPSSEEIDINFKNDDRSCENDETRSVLLKAGVPAGTGLFVFDDPDGGRSDDWTEIQIHPTMSLDHDVCVSSYEVAEQIIDGLVWVKHHRHNGLDGKVSRARVEPPVPGPW